MINIQRNFYVDNIIKQLPKINLLQIKKLPYIENIICFKNNNNINIYLLDVDKYRSLKTFKNSIKKIYKNSKITFLIPISKNKKKIDNIESLISSSKNIIIINIFKIGVKKCIDTKRERFFSSYLTVDLQIELSNILGRYINLILLDDVRLLAIDLDNTLWQGILGEDGISKIKLNLYQRKSLEILNSLSKKGFLISLHSKNNEKEALRAINYKFKKNKYFLKNSLKFINWDSKINTIKKAIKIVNFSNLNTIFLDDSISEIKQMERVLPKNNVFWCRTASVLYNVCKILNFINHNKTHNPFRSKDISANVLRTKITEKQGIIEYLKDAKLKILIRKNSKINIKRCSELSKKTNQFNSNYLRLSEANISKFLKSKNNFLYEFQVVDKYSNSGIVAFLFLQLLKKKVNVLEYVISCRALGRGLEYLFLKEAITKFDNEVFFLYKKTKRNEPFINFIRKISLSKINFNKNKVCFNKFNKVISGYTKYIYVKFN
jgi:FkbH-like protein